MENNNQLLFMEENMNKDKFKLEGYPINEYIEIDDKSVDFPNEIYISFAVCSKECGNMQFIVDGSTQVCEYCGKSMFRTVVKNIS